MAMLQRHLALVPFQPPGVFLIHEKRQLSFDGHICWAQASSVADEHTSPNVNIAGLYGAGWGVFGLALPVVIMMFLIISFGLWLQLPEHWF